VAAGARSAYTLAAGVASAKVPLRNSGIHSGDADVYAWGLSDANEGLATNDIRAVGVETFPSGGDAFMVFAVNTYGRWGSASDNEFQIGIDTNKDGVDDYYVLGVDAGAETGGGLNGQMEAFTIQASTGSVIDAFTVWAPANGSTVELPAQASDLGLTEGSSSFNYDATAFSFVGGPADVATGVGHFDALHPAISQGDFLSLGRGATAALGVTVNKAGFAAHPALGWMVVTLDDANGAPQADLLPVGNLP
jgi:hypothetical protein